MKKLLALLLALGMTMSLAACGGSGDTEEGAGGESSGDPTKLTLILRGGTYADVIKECLPAFEAEHNVKCEVQELEESDLYTGIAMDAINAQGTYDLCMVDGSWMAEFTENGVLANLSELGYELKDASMEMLGRARQVKGTKEDTTIVDGMGDKKAIADRVAQIKAQLEVTTSDFDKEKLQERLAKLAGGVAVIKVGAATEVEMKEKKLRIEDALNATKAAVEEGIVAGGGTAPINAIPAVEKTIGELEGDQRTGACIVRKALESPLRQIAANAGLEGSVIIDKILASGKVNYGFDAQKEEYVDMIAAGIVDPTKVTRSALENAASVASMVLTTESLVADEPEEPAPAAPGAAGGMGGMY